MLGPEIRKNRSIFQSLHKTLLNPLGKKSYRYPEVTKSYRMIDEWIKKSTPKDNAKSDLQQKPLVPKYLQSGQPGSEAVLKTPSAFKRQIILVLDEADAVHKWKMDTLIKELVMLQNNPVFNLHMLFITNSDNFSGKLRSVSLR